MFMVHLRPSLMSFAMADESHVFYVGLRWIVGTDSRGLGEIKTYFLHKQISIRFGNFILLYFYALRHFSMQIYDAEISRDQKYFL